MINITAGNFQIILCAEQGRKLEMVHAGPVLSAPEEVIAHRPAVFPWLNKTDWAYPVWGGGTFHEPAAAFLFHDGQIGADFFYDSHRRTELEGGSLWEIRLKDSHYPLSLTLCYRTWENYSVIEQSVLLENGGEEDLGVKQLASGFVRLRGEGFHLTHLAGSWADENRLFEEKMDRGLRIFDSREGCRTTRHQNPAALVSRGDSSTEMAGEVFGFLLAWDGNWRLAFEMDDKGDLLAQGGMNPFMADEIVPGGGELRSPTLVMTWSGEGRGPISRQYHRWANDVKLASRECDVPVLLNSWEGAYFGVNGELIEQFIDDAAEIGVGMFVLDDGWFGSGEDARNSDKAGLGDWEVNGEKFPAGLRPLAKRAGEKGLKFGLWLEPEMVNPQSRLYRDHPDWIVNNPHHQPLTERFQLMLDLGNPEVEAYILKVLDGYLREIPEIGYIKWDCNRQVTSPGSARERRSQTAFYREYEEAFLRIIDRLRINHPHVLFQACASGGGRMNYGALERFHEFWTSDNTDPYQRIFIQWGTGLFYPSRCMASHVTASPNHQTGRETPLKYRFDVAMSGRLGLELQPSRMTEEERVFSKKAIREYGKIQPVLFNGDLYRLRSPYDSPLASLMYVSRDRKEAVLFAWLMKRLVGDSYAPVKLQGLDESFSYRVEEINPLPPKVDPSGIQLPRTLTFYDQILSGSYLCHFGVDFQFYTEYSSAVVYLKAE
ncbi:MAG: alpha-galactosidase [Spirochaetales bacterium]|nr:alpha-galactosidase [Spirochaetales bacterium]